MASSTESLLRLELQATNENDGTWGTKNNTNIELLARAIAGHESISIAGSGSITLSTNNYSDDQAREAFLTLTGTLTGNRTVIIPSSSKLYVVRRNTGNPEYTVGIRTASGIGVNIPDGSTVLVACDGTNTYAITDATLRAPVSSAVQFTGGVALSASTTTSALGVATQGYVVNALTSVYTIAGGTINGNVTVSTASPSFVLVKTAGNSALIEAKTGSTRRWLLNLGDGTTESGSNNGSDFILASYDDAGSFLANAMTVSRRTTATTFAGNVVTNGTMSAVSYITTSDEKLKTNLQPLEGVLENVERLSPTYFTWSKEAQAKGKGPDRELGLLAQQLAVNFPELVHEDPGATQLMGQPTLGIDYSKVAVLALAAIQELSAKVRDLERQLNAN